MKLKRAIISVVFGAAAMLGISYTWHGVFLNDFAQIDDFWGGFFFLYILLYFCISIILTFLITWVELPGNKIINRLGMGGVLGFFIYLVAFVLGVSFNSRGVEHLVLDFSWQICEQVIGAYIIHLVFEIQTHISRIKQFEKSSYES